MFHYSASLDIPGKDAAVNIKDKAVGGVKNVLDKMNPINAFFAAQWEAIKAIFSKLSEKVMSLSKS